MKPAGSPSIAEGTLLKDYRVAGCLGRGSMGEVYEAVHQRTGRRVAIKVLREDVDAQLNASKRLLEEARAVSAIRHPGIVEVLDVGLHANRRPFMVLELLEGISLSQRIKQSPVPPTSAVRWLESTLGALEAAHQAGVVHRDLKPSNVYLCGEYQQTVKILDFGVARREGRQEQFTAPSMAVGSVGFMAPEQLMGQATASSDLYAVGCIAFMLFTSRPVFPLKNIADTARLHLSAPPPTLRSIKPGLAPELDQWVARLLAKSPADRPRSARAALSELLKIDPDPQVTWSRQSTEKVPAFVPPTNPARPLAELEEPTRLAELPTDAGVSRKPRLSDSPPQRTDKAKTIFDT